MTDLMVEVTSLVKSLKGSAERVRLEADVGVGTEFLPASVSMMRGQIQAMREHADVEIRLADVYEEIAALIERNGPLERSE